MDGDEYCETQTNYCDTLEVVRRKCLKACGRCEYPSKYAKYFAQLKILVNLLDFFLHVNVCPISV